MNVTIHFKGLILYAPRSRAGEMRVIMPDSKTTALAAHAHTHAAAGSSVSGGHEHIPQILYDLSSVEGSTDQPGTIAMLPFRGWDLVLPKFDGTLDVKLYDIADVSKVLSASTRKTLDESKATSIIRLNAGKMATDHKSIEWEWLGNKNVNLGLSVTWTATTADDPFVIKAKPRHGGSEVEVLRLQADSAGDLEFMIRHFPVADSTHVDRPSVGNPDEGDPAIHFSLLYGMFDVANPDAFAVPIFLDGPRRPATSAKRGGKLIKAASAPITTMAFEPITCVPGGCPECCDDC